MAKDKKELKVEEKEPMFVVLYNNGGGEMHEVMLTYEQQQLIGAILMKITNDNIEVSDRVCCKITVAKHKVAIKEDSING